MWWGIGVVLAFMAAITAAYASRDEARPRAWLSSFGHVEPAGRTPNPGALAAGALLFGCSGQTASKCWDITRNEIRDQTITAMHQGANIQ